MRGVLAAAACGISDGQVEVGSIIGLDQTEFRCAQAPNRYRGSGLAAGLEGALVAGGGVEDGVGFAAEFDGEFEEVGGALFVLVGDVFVLGVVLDVSTDVFVDLVHGDDGGGGFQRVEGGFGGAFARAVVHDGDGGRDGLDEARVVAHVEAVVVDLIDIDGADEVVGGDEFGLEVPGEVAAVEEAEVAELEDEGGAVGVVGHVLGLLGDFEFQRVFAHLVGARGDELLVGDEAAEFEFGTVGLLEGKGVAGFEGDAAVGLDVAVGFDEEGPAGVFGVVVGVGLGDAFVADGENEGRRSDVLTCRAGAGRHGGPANSGRGGGESGVCDCR